MAQIINALPQQFPIATTEQAMAGKDNRVLMTPLTTIQAIQTTSAISKEWKTVVKQNIWSRIFETSLIGSGENNEWGNSYLLSINDIRSDASSNYTFLIQFSNNKMSQITQLSGNGTNSIYGIRTLIYNSNPTKGIVDVNFSDGTFLEEGENIKCEIVVLNGNLPTIVLETFIDDSTLPEDYLMGKVLQTKENAIVSQRFSSLEELLAPFIVKSKAIVENLNVQFLSGKESVDFALAAQGEKADTAVQSAKIGNIEVNKNGTKLELPAYPSKPEDIGADPVGSADAALIAAKEYTDTNSPRIKIDWRLEP